MRHLDNLEVGVATHTGRVRRSNEDDFLLCAPQDAAQMEQTGFVAAIADGMGGAAGGAEASRTAVRAAARQFLGNGRSVRGGSADGNGGDPATRMRRGFAAAVAEVYALAQENPNLRGMGTTLTVVNLRADRMVLGHVGDTRCLRLRDGELVQLSVDHAVREPDSYLTRCIGAGQQEVEVDVAEFDVRPGDVLLLMSDGLWGVVRPGQIQSAVESLPPQEAAAELVRLANRGGGPDNSTVIILRVRGTGPGRGLVEVELPADEVAESQVVLAATRSLVPSKWPWAVLVVGLLLLAAGVAKVWFGFDAVSWLLAG